MQICSRNADGTINAYSDATANNMTGVRGMAFKDDYMFVSNDQTPVARCRIGAGGTLSNCADTGARFMGDNFGIGMYESNDVALYDPDKPNQAAGSMAFSTVLTRGVTTVSSVDTTTLTALPVPLRSGSPPIAYDITTNTTYSGSIDVCLVYQAGSVPSTGKLFLLHYTNSAWVDVTTSVNRGTGTVCGQVSSLSPFVVASDSITDAPTSSSSATSDPHMIGANGNDFVSSQ
jgi:hypothetical protein